MLKEIFRFEIVYRLSRPATYIYFALLFLLAFAATSWDQISIGFGAQQIDANAPYAILQTISVFCLFGVLICSAIMGVPVFRDYDHNTREIYFTKPFTKADYLLGRFLGSLLITLVIFFGINLGTMAGHAMPWLDDENFQSFHLVYYLQPFLIFQLPLVIVTGAIFFALGSLSKRLLVIYTQGLGFIFLFIIALQLSSDLENEKVAALLDPFGFTSLDQLTKYWTISDKNTTMVPLSGIFLVNRVIWLSVSIVVFGITYRLFTFSNEPLIRLGKKRKKEESAQSSTQKLGRVITNLSLPRVTPQIDAKVRFVQLWEVININFLYVIRSAPFIAITLMGIILTVINSSFAQQAYGTPVQPVTYIMAGFLGSNFMLFFIILITFYAGELYWRERDYKISGVTDAFPIPTWINVVGKYLSLICVLVGLLFVLMLTGIGIQLWEGFYDNEIGTYLVVLFANNLPGLIELAFLAFVVHVIANHKFVGHAAVILLYLIFFFAFTELELTHNLYQYSGTPGFTYSDMNGTGPYGPGLFWFNTYWMALALLFGGIGYLLWQRGVIAAFQERWAEAKHRFNKSVTIYFSVFGLVFLGSGSFLFYNTNIINNYQTPTEREKEAAQYEKQYKKYDSLPQPKITAVNVKLDLYPSRRDFHIKGQYTLKNKTRQPIDTVFLELRKTDNMRVNELSFSTQAKQVYYDDTYPMYLFRLEQPLQPGDTAKLLYDLDYLTKGIANSGPNTSIVTNGTFINSRYLPHIGYAEQNELSGEDERNEYNLPRKPLIAKMEDTSQWDKNFIRDYADYVDFEATLGTKKGQKAVAPGYLTKKWEENDRNYYHYKMDIKIPHFYSFLSGNYAVDRQQWVNTDGDTIPIEIYHHKDHDYNIDKMQKGARQALDYYSTKFGPYPHKQLRIFEFPRYSGFAQSFPNTIPFSEGIGFIAKVGDDDIDYPFFVTAHEVAHQWWGHQILGAKVQGAQFLSEGLSEYSALMVMKHQYGKDKMRKFLEYELDDYLSGRSSERRKELPLMRVANQDYIAYNKGAVVMYALQDYIGEENMNKALRRFLKKNKYASDPYPISKELIREFSKVTPDSLQYVIEDMFKTITLYDNRVKKASYKELDNGRYEVTLTVKSKKYRADSVGRQRTISVNDWIDVGVFAQKQPGAKTKLGEPLYLEKRKIDETTKTLTITVDEKPAKAGLDPYIKLIDRNKDDNVSSLEEAS